jgi:hypothetical protein
MALYLANGGASTNLGLKILRVQEKGGRTDPRSAPGRPVWADTGQAHPGPVRSPFSSRGSSCVYALCPIHLHYFDDVILASKIEDHVWFEDRWMVISWCDE